MRILSILCLAASFSAAASPAAGSWTVVQGQDDPLTALAAKEIRRYLYATTGGLPEMAREPGRNHAVIVGASGASRLIPPEGGYAIESAKTEDGLWRVRISGAAPQQTLYGAYRFAEELGVRFFMHGDVIPDAPTELDFEGLSIREAPLFNMRGIQPFHDFPEGPDWWEAENYKAVIGQLPKMRMNFFGLHTYPQHRPMAEPAVWIGPPQHIGEGRGVEHSYPAAWFNTAKSGWGYQAKDTGAFSCGAAQLFDRDPYGSEVMRGLTPMPDTPAESNEVFERAGGLLNEAFAFAKALGVTTCIGTETPLVVPEEVGARLPQQQRLVEAIGGRTASTNADIAGTDLDAVYQTVRFDLEGYRIEIPPGRYDVRLRFSEITYDAPGLRVFGVAVEDRQVADALDIVERAGKDEALDLVLGGVYVEDGTLDITFTPVVEFPCVAGIVVEGENRTVKVNCGGFAYEDYAADIGAAPVTPEQRQMLYEGIFQRIAQTHPLDYYWFWTPEGWTWAGTTESDVEATLDDVMAAYAARDAVAPDLKLATCGWVLGPQYNRSLFDERLPKDVAVSCINRSVGHDPVEPGFADIAPPSEGGRRQWAIPWLEDDPAMTSPQLWVGRMRRDARDALDYGCTGLMGIHWRTRILAPNVSALARAAWDQSWRGGQVAQTTGVLGGQVAEYPGAEFEGTDNDRLYQSVRYGLVGYQFDVPDGVYDVTFYLAEPHYAEAGRRVFGAAVEGETLFAGLDMAGDFGFRTARAMTAENVEVEDGLLEVTFMPEVEMPCVAGLTVAGPNGYERRINCGGPAFGAFEKDLESAEPRFPTRDFYLDWASQCFGTEVGQTAAAILSSVDGELPRPSAWIAGPGGYTPDPRPWSEVREEYAFVAELEALEGRVQGKGNQERFGFWLDTFRFMRATGKMRCAWAVFNEAMEEAREAAPVERAAVATTTALPARIALVNAAAHAMRHMLQAVDTTGGMGTIANLEQHTFPGMLEAPAAELEAMLGEPLPAEAFLPDSYDGPVRVIVPAIRTLREPGERLRIKVIVLATESVAGVKARWGVMGHDLAWTSEANHVSRGVYEVAAPEDAPRGADLEYRIEVKTADGGVRYWPAVAPERNQTVVTAPLP